jgi:predicted Zn-dependent peptidase
MHIAAMLDRHLEPPAFKPSLPKLRRPDSEFLPNGIELSCFLSDDQSITELELIFPASETSSTIRQREGFLFRMLGEGTRTKTAKQLADAISFLGASLEFSHNPDFDLIHISCLSRFFQPMLDILEEVWSSPVFPEKEWKTLQETQINQNEIQLQKTSFLASRLLKQKLYSADLDYGYSPDPALISGIRVEEFPSIFSQMKSTGPALAILAGHAEKAAVSKLRDWLISFSSCKSIRREKLVNLPNTAPGIFWAEKPGSNQSSLRTGQYTIDSKHEDSALLSLTLEIFGGYFGSRLMNNIREDKGWTYGIYAQRIPNAGQPYWQIACDINAEASLLAVEEIKKEARILQGQLVGEEELEKVKNYMLGQFLSSITHDYGIAERYRSVWLNGTNFDRVEENQRIIREANATDILKTANHYLNIDKSIICLSGQQPA